MRAYTVRKLRKLIVEEPRPREVMLGSGLDSIHMPQKRNKTMSQTTQPDEY
jgi:hypothetical protein